MVIVTKNKISTFLTLGLSLLFLSSCGFKVSSIGSRTGSIISGVISPFAGLIAEQDGPFTLISSAYSVNCADPVYAKLFKIEDDGTISDSTPLASQLIGADARYQFDLKGLNLNTTNSKVDYIVKAEGCNGNIFKRPVTSFDSKQDIDFNSNIVAEIVNANALIAKKLNQVERNDVELLIKNLKGNNANTALDSLLNNQTNAEVFAKLFGTNPAVIQNAMPEVSIDRPTSNLNELSNSTFQAKAFHADPNYPFVYKWKLDNVLQTSSSTWIYNPSANESGSHQLTLQVGKNDGSGNIDLSKPYFTKTIAIVVNNNISTIAPDIAINASTPTPRNAPSIDVDLNTGAAFANCASFSHLAITETASVPTATQFNFDCTSAGTQTETVNFSSGDGLKTLYLWAIDEEGNISSPKTVNLILDTAPPVASIAITSTILKGGAISNISLSASDAGVGMQDLKLYFASDAATYALVSNLSVTANSYSWTVPTSNTTNGKFKLVATDLVGSTTTVYSSLFEIDSVNPSSPSFSISSASPTSSSVVSTTMSACGADVAQILLTESNIQPTGVESGWQNCSTSAGAHSITISGNGVHNLYVWSKDAAGNIATASSTQAITLDTTPPSISSGPSVATAMNKGGANKTISWSLTDTTTATIALSYSLDNGSTYTSIATGLTNNGSYNWTIPNANSNQVLLKLVATDQLNFSSQATSSAFTIDSTAPTVAVTTPTGPLKGGSTITLNYSASDTNTISTLELAYAADGITFGAPTSLTVGTTSSSWVVNSGDATTAKLKIIATDIAGNVGTAITNAFTIDSTPPTVPTFARTSAAITSATTVTMTLGSCADIAGILITESFTPPSAGAAGWQACSTTAGATTSTVTGDGTHNLYAWAKDAVGNVTATANSISMNLDTTNPTIAAIGSAIPSQVGGGKSQAITWSVTDANTATINLEYYNGTSWNSIATGLANSGSYTWATPTIDSNQVKIRITATDVANNQNTASSSTFTIDSTAPTLSSVSINDGASFAGTSIINIKVNAADNLSAANQISLRFGSANTSTQDCQSEYVDNNWQIYSNATTALLFTITPVDEIKKICAWVKDGAGNISVINSPTTGVAGVNFDTIEYQTGTPPTIDSFTVTRTSDGGLTATTGQPLTISWSISDFEELATKPINFSYTTDGSTWFDIVTAQNISNPANITWFGNLAAGTKIASGNIATFNAPSSSFFRLKAQAVDIAGNTSNVVISQTFNTGRWSVYAGSKDRGDGGTGKPASLYGVPSVFPFAINPINGDIYAVDESVGIRKLDAKTGLVSTVIADGNLNLPDDGALPANPKMPIGYLTNPIFDSKGRLYLTRESTMYVSTLYQIDFENQHVRKYAGGGTSDDGGVPATSLRVAIGGMSFDEQNSLYLFTITGQPATSNDLLTFGKRIIKIEQNPDGTPGTTTRVAGNGTTALPTSGQLAINAPVLNNASYSIYSSITAWDNGNKIYVHGYNNNLKYKISNGTIYLSNAADAYTTGAAIYNPVDGYIYKPNSTGGIDKVLLNMNGANGDITTTLFNGDSTNLGCAEDGTSKSSFCGKVDKTLQIKSGVIYFADGISVTKASNYSIRFFDSNDKLRTIFGTKPFYGDGLDRSLIKGNFGSIYYKTATEAEGTTFPEGLYFMESNGVVFGRINTNGTVNQLWGNQARIPVFPANDTVISKGINMGEPYSLLDGALMTFDNEGHPWIRISRNLIKINGQNKVTQITNSSVGNNIGVALNNANPVNYGLSPYTGRNNLTLKDQGAFVAPNYVATGNDPLMTLRFMDFTNLNTPIIMGGGFKASDNKAASADVTTVGQVVNAPLWSGCKNGACNLQYNEDDDKLYIAENNKLRFITTPDVPTTSVLTTLFTLGSDTFQNFNFNPSRNQLWYFTTNGGLYCYDMGSGKASCNNTTDYFAIRTSANLTVKTGPNQITFKDDQTMFISTYNGEILKFDVPTN